jgi:hypothetical protein
VCDTQYDHEKKKENNKKNLFFCYDFIIRLGDLFFSVVLKYKEEEKKKDLTTNPV